MDFHLSAAARDACQRMWGFMPEEVFPADPCGRNTFVNTGSTLIPPIMEPLKESARSRGLWNLFLPAWSGLSNLDYAIIAEISGWSPVIAPEATNCQAPDTGNMRTLELFTLELFATSGQRTRWLEPLKEGRIRSAFAMTEPAVASSDATNVETISCETVTSTW